MLLQVHIAEEQTKFGFNENELMKVETELYPNINIAGLMGMATFTDDKEKVKREFEILEKEIADLNLEKKMITQKFGNDALSFEELQQFSVRISEITKLLDEKELRWLELSELMN